jgi:hypothetical protein
VGESTDVSEGAREGGTGCGEKEGEAQEKVGSMKEY